MAERTAKRQKKAEDLNGDKANTRSDGKATLNLAMIGNCSFSALLDKKGRIVWCCIPRFDGDPIFCSLMKEEQEESGFFEIALEDFARSEQHYMGNTAIVKTLLYDTSDNCVEIIDFAPRFKQFGRIFRPIQLVRQVRRVQGSPRIRVRVSPLYGYGANVPATSRGTNHIRYILEHSTVRLTTDIPISYILEEIPFIMEDSHTLILGPDESMRSAPSEVGRVFFDHTTDYWREWSRSLSIPFEYQAPVIRAAITLQLCAFEETGAIVAAMTTSVPEAPNTERNWDYRFCWLRDSFFTVQALNRLGVTDQMENYLRYISNIVASSKDGILQPVYGITMASKIDERIEPHLSGYRGMGPVRVGNDAYRQIQHDVYGSVILATTQMFFDKRLTVQGDEALFRRLEQLGEKAASLYDKPDAGIWELRTMSNVHTFSSLLCWAACDRLAKIAIQLNLPKSASGKWLAKAVEIKSVIEANAFDAENNTFVSTFGGKDVDACLLLMEELGFVQGNDTRFIGTVKAIETKLRRSDYMMRYDTKDDFGFMESAFNICTFWYIDALNAIGRKEEARNLFDNMIKCCNNAGLLSEDLDINTGELWGNFPQTYSLVGLINCALGLSKPWARAF